MGNGTFQELVSLEWAISQPQTAIETLLAGVDRIDAALNRLGTEGAARFSANLQINLTQAGQAVNLLSAQYERLISLQQQASQTGGGVLTANRFGQPVAPAPAAAPQFGTERMNVYIDEERRQAEREALMSTPMFQNLKQKVQEMRGGGYGIGGGGAGLDEEEWLTPVTPRIPRQTGSADLSAFQDLFTQNRIQSSATSAGLGLPEYERISKLGEQAFASQEKFGNSAKGVTQAVEAEGRSMSLLDNHFVNHAVSVAELIVIYEGFRFAGEAVQGLINQYITLESVTARLNYIQGDQDLTGQFQRAAQSGISPTEAVPGFLAGAQLGASSTQQRQAEQISLIFGTDQYENALKELVQTQTRANAAGVEEINVMGYLATAYKTRTGDLETYMDALQNGIEVQDTFGLSAEKSALAILKISQGTEMSADSVANMIERMKKSIEVPKNLETLRGLGVKGETPGDILRESASLEVSFIQSGQMGKAEQLAGALSGGLGGVQTLRQMKVALTELNAAFDESGQKLDSWSNLQDEVSNTTASSMQRLNASWGVFTATLSDTGPVKAFFDYLNERLLGSTTNILSSMTTLGEDFSKNMQSLARDPIKALSGTAFNLSKEFKSGDSSQGYEKFIGGTGESFLQMILDPLGFQSRMIGALAGGDKASGEQGGLAGSRTGFPGTEPLRATGTIPEPPAFGGFRDLPKETDWGKFVQNVRAQESKIKEQVPEYQMDRRTIAFYDQSIGSYRKLVADSEAIRLATEDQNKLLQQITGIFNVPAGGEVLVPFSALQSGFMPSDRYAQMSQGISGGATQSAVQESAGQATPMIRNRIPGSKAGTLYDSSDHERTATRRTASASDDHEQGRSRDSQTTSVQVYVDGQQVASRMERTLYRRSSGRMRGGTGGLLVS